LLEPTPKLPILPRKFLPFILSLALISPLAVMCDDIFISPVISNVETGVCV
jgi:hypothetical protein